MVRFLAVALLCAVAAAVFAEDTVYKSGKSRTNLIELYTSEGCSSCPPAERWLSMLKNSPGLWEEFVPVAFHVDYWDYIGWKDPFAKHEYSQRQRRYAAEFSESTVYTPGVRVAGFEWRGWRSEPEPLKNADSNTAGQLSLTLKPDRKISAEFAPPEQSSNKARQLTLALLGLGITSQVARGENKGRELHHDFVVLATTTLSGSTKNGKTHWRGTLPQAGVSAPEYALAAWVSEGGSQVPIQAVGGVLAN